MNNSKNIIYGTPGTVSHGTLNPDHLIPRFMAELRKLNPECAKEIESEIEIKKQGAVDEDELVDVLFDALEDCAPDGYYFGAHIGDGSDFGFWAGWPVREGHFPRRLQI